MNAKLSKQSSYEKVFHQEQKNKKTLKKDPAYIREFKKYNEERNGRKS